MKIFLFLEHLIAEHKQFRRDLWHVRVSLALRPRNWSAFVHDDNRIMLLSNDSEHMNVWIGNRRWGLNFVVNDRQYGGVTLFVVQPWRYKLWAIATKAVDDNRINLKR